MRFWGLFFGPSFAPGIRASFRPTGVKPNSWVSQVWASNCARISGAEWGPATFLAQSRSIRDGMSCAGLVPSICRGRPTRLLAAVVVRQAHGAAVVVVVGSLSGIATRSSRQRSKPCSAAAAAQEPQRWRFQRFRRRCLLARSGPPVSAARQGRLRVVDDDGGLGSVLRCFCCLAWSGAVLGPATRFACILNLGRSVSATAMNFVAWSFAGPRRPWCGTVG